MVMDMALVATDTILENDRLNPNDFPETLVAMGMADLAMGMVDLDMGMADLAMAMDFMSPQEVKQLHPELDSGNTIRKMYLKM